LVMSTLHTLDATETINRIISVFASSQQKQVRLQLAATLKAVISQRLVARADGKGRVAAVEILKATARVREMIEDKDRTKEIADAIAQGHLSYGMQTFDQSLMWLVKNNLGTYDSKWDSFDQKAGEPAAPAPGSTGFAQKGAPAASLGGAPRQPTATRAAAPAPAKPKTPSGGESGGGGDDFQIERF